MRPTHPLKAWRKAQLVDDPASSGKRSMRLFDVQRLYGIPIQTWSGWEKYPDEPGFRRPDEANMHRLFDITGGAIEPNHFYPIGEWQDGGAQPAAAR